MKTVVEEGRLQEAITSKFSAIKKAQVTKYAAEFRVAMWNI